MRKISSVIVMLAMVFSLSSPSFAANGEWVGTTNATWATTTNWNPNTTPGTGNTATFDTAGNGNTTINLGGGVTINTIAFNTSSAAAYTIGSGGVGSQTLTLNDSGAITVSGTVTNNQTFNANVDLGTDATSQSDTITNNSSSTLTFAGNITGSTAGSAATDTFLVNGSGNTTVSGNISNGSSTTVAVTQSGTGALTLSGTNTYTGATTLSSGTLNINSTTALGATASTFSINGGTINNTSGSAITNANNNAITLGGSFGFGTGAGTASNDLNLGTGAVSNAGNYTITLNGHDTLTLGGVMTNTETGANTLTVNNGTGTNSTTALNLGGYALSNSSTNYNDVINGSGNVNITGGVTNGASSNSSLTYSGTGTLTLSGAGTYTGGTTISSGTLEATTSASALGTGTVTLSGGTLDLYNNSALAYGNNVTVSSSSTINSDTLTAGAGVTHTLGTLGIASGDTLTVGLANTASSGTQGLTFGAVTLSGSATIDAVKNSGGSGALLTLGSVSGSGDALTIEGTANTTISGTVNVSSLALGTGANTSTLTLNGAATIGTVTFGSGDTLALNNNLTGGIDFNNNAGTVTVASGDSISGGIQNSTGAANKGTVNFLGSTTISGGNLGSSTANEGLVAVNFEGGSSTLDNNIYATTTTLSNSATLTTIGGQRTVSGALTLGGTSTLNIGTTNLVNGGIYTQGSGTSLDLTIDSTSTYGYITNTGHTAVVNNGSTVNVTVGGYIPNGATFDIVNTGGTGITGGTPTVNALYSNLSTDPFITFTSSVAGNNDIITANHTSSGFSSLGSNPNAAAVGNVLDNETSPSSDLANILNTLESSSPAQVRSALNTLTPTVDRGALDTSMASLDSFTGAAIERAQNVLELASSGESGVSAGDASLLNSLWAKQYGGYLDQGTREGIEGYNSWNTGTAVGVDHLFNDNFTLGASLGYAYGSVSSDANSGSSNINSADGTLYAAYQGTNRPYYIDAAGSLAENWYSSQRDITVDTINRIADAQYKGTQSGIYLEGGYKFDLGNNVQLTPLTSLQWTHLYLNRYDETNAGDLDLNVNSQRYNILESGLGASITYPVKLDWVDVTSEFHVKWLYDYIDDDISITSTFAGGGSSFTTNGAAPARDGADIGGKVSFDLKNDVSVVGELDTEYRDNLFGIAGSVSVRYKF